MNFKEIFDIVSHEGDGEHRGIKNEIQKLLTKIKYMKKRMYNLVEGNEVPQVTVEDVLFKEDIDRRISNMNDTSLDVYTESEINIFKTFINIKHDANFSEIIVSFPLSHSELYGIKIVKTKNDKFSIISTYLPPSIDITELRKQADNILINDITSIIQKLHEDIFAFIKREEQINKLQEVKHPNLGVYHSECCRYLELQFLLTDLRTKEKFSVSVALEYNVESLRPANITIGNRSGLNADIKAKLLEQLNGMYEQDLQDAYATCFKNNNSFQFY